MGIEPRDSLPQPHDVTDYNGRRRRKMPGSMGDFGKGRLNDLLIGGRARLNHGSRRLCGEPAADQCLRNLRQPAQSH